MCLRHAAHNLGILTCPVPYSPVRPAEMLAATTLKSAHDPGSPGLAPAVDKVSGPNGSHFDKLDHLRFLAALLILLHHGVPAVICAVNGLACDAVNTVRLTANLSGLDLIAKALVFEGHSAVALFITLSGFLFARICGTAAIRYDKFVVNRILRIYPMYTCAILLAMYLAPASNGIVNLATSLFCLQNLLSPVAHTLITPPLWTVAVEFQFYLLFPFFLQWFSKRGAKPILLLLAASLLTKCLVFLQTGSVRELSYLTLFGRIDQFIVGMLAGWYYLRFANYLRNPLLVLVSSSVVVSMLTIFHLKGGFLGTANKSIWLVWPLMESVAWMFVIVTYCASSFKLPERASKVLCALGAVSFSMYLCHYGFAHLIAQKLGPVIKLALSQNDHWLHPLVAFAFQQQFYGSIAFVFLIILPATVIFSGLTYFAVEKPFMDMRVKYKL